MAVDITALYCCLDDFCKVFADWEAHRLIPSQTTRQRTGKLSRSEMLFIVVLFHLSPYKNFKVFYLYGIGAQYRACFDALPHYDRFVSLMPRLFVPLMVLLHGLSGEPTGVYFVDSTKLAVCHNRRIHRHKVFDGLAARGKTSMGWFYGLKLHFVINHKGQIMALKITPGNTADSTVLDEMTRHLAGKLYADKGYIGQDLFKTLWQRGLHLITGIRRNMRNYPMPMLTRSCCASASLSKPSLIPSSLRWALSIHATGRPGTPWSMFSPALSLMPSDPESLPSPLTANIFRLIRSWGSFKVSGSPTG